MLLSDIHDIIASFLNNFTDLMSWRHTCHGNFHDYTAHFYCTRMYSFIKTPYVRIDHSTNLSLLRRRDYIESIIIANKYIEDEHIMNLTNLKYMKIWPLPFILTDVAFIKLSNLKVLLCPVSNYINDNVLKRLPNLTELDCTECKLVTSESLVLLTNLVKLTCINNPTLDTSFVKKLTKLEHLTIDNSVQNYNDALCRLEKLKRLNIPNEAIYPDNARVLLNLEYINCGHYEYTDEHIMHLTNLKYLVCGRNSFFTDISVKNLEKLEIFITNNTNLAISIEAFNCLENLREFYSGNLQISDLSFEKLSKLEILHCESNCLLTDTCLSYVPNLIELNCGQNTNFTDNGVSQLSNLRILNCGANTNLTDLTLSKLSNLTRLNCGHNRNFRHELQKISYRLISLEYIFNNSDNGKFNEFMNLFISLSKQVNSM